MLNDLFRGHGVIGMTKQELITLLGPDFGPFGDLPPTAVVYRVGGFGMDSMYVIFEFKNERVINYKVESGP